MNEIEANVINNTLVITQKKHRKVDSSLVRIDLKDIILNTNYEYKIRTISEVQKNKVLLFTKVEDLDYYNDMDDTEAFEETDKFTIYEEKYILVYTVQNAVKYVITTKSEAYKHLLSLKYKVLKVKLTKKKISFVVLAYIINKYDLKIDEVNLQIGDFLKKKAKLNQYPNKISKKQLLLGNAISKYEFNIKDVVNDESFINGTVKFSILIGDVNVDFQIGKKKKHIKHKKNYYIPMMSKYVGDYAVHIRRTMKGNLIFVKRLKEPIEYSKKFRILESRFVSRAFYYISKLIFRKRKINIYYEKFSEKAEEGTFELCKLAQKSNNTKNYFIIDENSSDYLRIKNEKFVIPKYSLKYYWLLYNAKTFIATETQMHSNILRSNNKYLRKNINEKKFIFLQHGIIFMKNLGINSTFIKGREAEPDYMVVSSDYEKEVVMDMLNLPEERLLKTGLVLYSKLGYKHITNSSEDYITIMYTWKPYEEYLSNFEDSTYYKNLIEVYQMLVKYIDKDKIRIVAHPKVFDLLESTDLNNIIWKDSISSCLESTKLLITDYSSVCYNAFYQGAGVLFYQPDLLVYEKENGKLIPNDDEYIGKRAFNINELENIIKNSIIKNSIILENVRNKKYEENYSKINEFSDGKNADRLVKELKKLNII